MEKGIEIEKEEAVEEPMHSPSELRTKWLALTAILFGMIVLYFGIIFCFVLTPEDDIWRQFDINPCVSFCENAVPRCRMEDPYPLVVQPANSFSNLAYVLAGLMPFVRALVVHYYDRRRNQQYDNTWLQRFFQNLLHMALNNNLVGAANFFAAACYCGVGSFMFHASMTRYWHLWDTAGMYTFEVTLVAQAIHALTGLHWLILTIPVWLFGVIAYTHELDMKAGGPLNDRTMFCYCGIVLVASTTVLVICRCCLIFRVARQKPKGKERKVLPDDVPLSSRARIKEMKALGLSPAADTNVNGDIETTLAKQPVEKRLKIEKEAGPLDNKKSALRRIQSSKWTQMARVVLVAMLPGPFIALAVLCQRTDASKAWCNPDSLIQGHAFWHLLTALAAYLGWTFFERNKLPDMIREARRATKTTSPEMIIPSSSTMTTTSSIMYTNRFQV